MVFSLICLWPAWMRDHPPLGFAQARAEPNVPNLLWGNTLGTCVLLKGGCSNGVQSTHGWGTAHSTDPQPPSWSAWP